MILTKQEFLQQYILTRTSHKKELKDLLHEAIEAWNFIENSC